MDGMQPPQPGDLVKRPVHPVLREVREKSDEQHLRSLLSDHNPKAATMGFQQLLDSGLVFLGLQGFMRVAEGEAVA